MLGFVVACLAPLAAVVATDLGRDPGASRVETAADRGESTEPTVASGETGGTGGPGGTGTTDTTAGSTTTTAPPGDPATTSPPTEPPATTATTAAPAPPGTPAPAPPTTPAPAPAPLSPIDQVVISTNTHRASAGCPPVQADPRLTAAAQAHSDDMANRNYFSHTTPEGITFGARIKAAGYPSPGGENIAKGQATARDVMAAWMDSDGHRENILRCTFTTIGVGYNARARTWTQDFGY
jgi:uncharacterized protein YkwD